ncbi:MAG TPA: sugar ABC transporter ATP-binding protein [Tepidisphaeraceae bacterium]|jgi:ribose transport system ATP-binding protein|nr:sugar ABC transporter ATP-binding protein [Tepidisphaeraceae bacterium]
MTAITKMFSGVPALQDVDLEVRPGEVHALIGENGAGKSTLMGVLAGRFSDYRGEISFAGESVRIDHPRRALAMGIAVIYQELSVLPNLTVAENILLGQEPAGPMPGTIDAAAIRSQAQRVLDYLQFDLPIDEPVDQLSAASQVMVEIARAIHRNAKLLVFDEPTASLGNKEVDALFAVISDLKRRGLGVIYISHRLAELPRICDRVTVLRDGRKAATCQMADCRLSDLTQLMLGRDLADVFPQRRHQTGSVILEVRDVMSPSGREISFDLHAGEILGIAGMVGSGRTEIVRAIFGADHASGTVALEGKRIASRSPGKCQRLGIYMVPEDRKRDGNITGRSILENITASVLPKFSTAGGFLRRSEQRRFAIKMIDRMRVNPPAPEREIQLLSGGNQQKVIVGRVLAGKPRVLIFDEPTQGIDVGTKAQIYRLIVDLAEQGCGIILISSEFVEITELADRILVLRDGQLIAELPGHDADEEKLYSLCLAEAAA